MKPLGRFGGDMVEVVINKTFREAAKAFGMSFEDTLKNIKELIEIELKEHACGPVHDRGLDHDHAHDHSRE